jgi:hypothetical protein
VPTPSELASKLAAATGADCFAGHWIEFALRQDLDRRRRVPAGARERRLSQAGTTSRSCCWR